MANGYGSAHLGVPELVRGSWWMMDVGQWSPSLIDARSFVATFQGRAFHVLRIGDPSDLGGPKHMIMSLAPRHEAPWLRDSVIALRASYRDEYSIVINRWYMLC